MGLFTRFAYFTADKDIDILPITLLVTIVVFILVAVVQAQVLKLPRNIWLLFLAQPLAMSASPVLVFIGGILASKMAPDPSLATLPLTTMILGVAAATIPAAMLAKKVGRKKATLSGFSFAFIGSVLAMFAAANGWFWLFIIASLSIGISLAFVQQLRFAAIESAGVGNDTSKALAALMFAGLFAAFLGPEVAVMAREWLDSPYGYAGSFGVLALMVLMAMVIMLFFDDPPMSDNPQDGQTRSLVTITKQPLFIVAITVSVCGYGLMSLLMTATPLSMHNNVGHSLVDTKWVIQSHITAMYLPSLFTPWLAKRLGLQNLLLIGTMALFLVCVVALSGQAVMHYWWTLVLLGLGWNLLFFSGTSLLPQTYHNNERHKVQAINDFTIFFVQGLSSLLAGWLLFKSSWHTLVYASVPFIIIVFIASIYYYRQQKANLIIGNKVKRR
ncbi:MAG: MFS family permease [Alteromonadaceae bacterium]